MPGTYITLGTDGYGRSDARKALREHFEVDRRYIVVTALNALAEDGALDRKTVAAAIEKYGIDPDRPDPVTLCKAGATMAETIEITVPDLGDFSDVEVIEVLVSAGDTVEREDGLVTVETDKASMDIPAPENGKIDSLTVSVGDTVSTGDVIGKLTVGSQRYRGYHTGHSGTAVGRHHSR